MSWNRRIAALSFVALLGCAIEPASAAPVCPVRDDAPLRFVDVFDGAPDEHATLVPDQAGATAGSWQLGYVYDAGRFVTVRCKYADGQTSDVKLAKRIARCDYRISADKTLGLNCR